MVIDIDRPNELVWRSRIEIGFKLQALTSNNSTLACLSICLLASTNEWRMNSFIKVIQ